MMAAFRLGSLRASAAVCHRSHRRQDHEGAGEGRWEAWCGRHSAFAWLTQTQLAPVIWAIILGLVTMFTFKVGCSCALRALLPDMQGVTVLPCSALRLAALQHFAVTLHIPARDESHAYCRLTCNLRVSLCQL